MCRWPLAWAGGRIIPCGSEAADMGAHDKWKALSTVEGIRIAKRYFAGRKGPSYFTEKELSTLLAVAFRRGVEVAESAIAERKKALPDNVIQLDFPFVGSRKPATRDRHQ